MRCSHSSLIGKIVSDTHIYILGVINQGEWNRMLKKLLNMISRTQAEEIDCSDVYSIIDVYAEAVARGEDPSSILPLVKQHLEICGACLEEYEALMRILEQTTDS